MSREEILEMLDGLSTEDLVILRDEILAMLRNHEPAEDHPPGADQSDQ